MEKPRVRIIVIGDGTVGKTALSISVSNLYQERVQYMPSVFDNAPPIEMPRFRAQLSDDVDRFHHLIVDRLHRLVTEIDKIPSSHGMIMISWDGTIRHMKVLEMSLEQLDETPHLPDFEIATNDNAQYTTTEGGHDKIAHKEQRRKRRSEMQLRGKDIQRKAPIKYAERKNVGRQNYNFH